MSVLAACLLLLRCDNYEFPASQHPRIETLPVAEVTESGALFQATIAGAGSETISDHGFVWGPGDEPALGNSEKIRLGPASAPGDFEAQVTYGMEAGKEYFVKAFAVSGRLTVYGNPVSFTSKGSTLPVISGISPETGTWGDTVSIRGARFSTLPAKNAVRFDTFQAVVVTSSDTLIRCLVPNDISSLEVPVTVAVSGYTVQSPVSFALVSPSISAFSPSTGTYGDVVTISGARFSAIASQNTVKFNEHVAQVTEATETTLKVIVPNGILEKENEISVTVNVSTARAVEKFSMKGPAVTGISAAGGYIGETVQILGEFFCPIPAGNQVTFAGSPVAVESASGTALTVRIPDVIYKNRSNQFTVTVAGQSVTTSQSLTVQDPWIRKASVPAWNPVTVFTASGQGFAVLYNICWRYDPVENLWEQRADFPGEATSDLVAFEAGNRGYLGLGYRYGYTREFYSYDPVNDSWEQVADFPTDHGHFMVGLSVNGKGYIAEGYGTIRMFEYDPALDRWEQKPGELDAVTGGPYVADAGFAIGNRLFVYLADETTAPNPLYEYDLNAGAWVDRGSPEPYDPWSDQYTTGYALGNKGYIRGSRSLFVYDPVSGSWETAPGAPPGIYSHASSYTVNNRVYFVGEYLGDSYAFWEYDPDYD
jgi:hypothetical protein